MHGGPGDEGGARVDRGAAQAELAHWQGLAAHLVRGRATVRVRVGVRVRGGFGFGFGLGFTLGSLTLTLTLTGRGTPPTSIRSKLISQ